MSTIKLPVKAHPGELFWSVSGPGGELCRQLPESQAREIARALNLFPRFMWALDPESDPMTPAELRGLLSEAKEVL